MIKKQDYDEACKEALYMIEETGITVTEKDRGGIEVADFGLNNFKKEGVQILTMFETERIAGKILVLFPFQTEPEHWHPSVGNDPGKEEIIRAISGELFFYIPGTSNIKRGFIISEKENFYTVRHEVVMNPGEQLILSPGTKHWFQAGEKGAVLYSFSTKVRDTMDCFSDPNIVRETIIKEQ